MKPKDLAMMPARVALALQADGWYLRQQIPWLKHNCMPESATDRPTSAVEYIYLFSKQESYYYDRETVRMAASGNGHDRGGGVNPKAMGPNSRMRKDQDPYHTEMESRVRCKQNRSFSAAVHSIVSTRARRNSDWFFASIATYQREFQGMLVDGAGDPLAMIVNPQPFSLEMCGQCETIYAQPEYRKLNQDEDKRRICTCGAKEWVSHFATFPEHLVKPMILAGTSEHGCCADCGAPYERILERAKAGDWHPDPKHKHDAGAVNGTAKWAKQSAVEARCGMRRNGIAAIEGAHSRDGGAPPATLGWRPTCDHPMFVSEPVPCKVLDPFSGSGRTGLAAFEAGRSYVGLEANPRYVKMSEWQFQKRFAGFGTEYRREETCSPAPTTEVGVSH
jgi:hypothetical protein